MRYGAPRHSAARAIWRHASAKERHKRGQRADAHAKAGPERRASNAPFQNEKEQELKSRAENGHKNIEEHAHADLPADAKIIIHRKNDRGDGRADRIYAQILHGIFGKRALRAHGHHEERRQRVKQNAHKNTCAYNHQTGAGKNLIRFFVLLLSQRNGYGNGRTDADQIGKRKIDNDERHGEIERRKCRFSEELPDKNAVDKLVQRRRQHTDSARNRRKKEKLMRRLSGKQCVGIHKTLIMTFL